MRPLEMPAHAWVLGQSAHEMVACTPRSASATPAGSPAWPNSPNASSGPRAPAAAAPLPLTDREREILTMAAQGLTNRDIATRLVVSVRTVETHRYRACCELGTTDRDDLAALLRGE